MIPEPHKVFIKENNTKKKLLGYACPECHLFHSGAIYVAKTDDALKASFEAAKQCCHKTCSDCGVEIKEKYYTACAKCRAQHTAKKEKELYEKAKKVTLKEYKHEWFYFCDEFFSSYEELLEHVQYTYDVDDMVSGNIPPVWGCVALKFKMDAYDVIENALQEHYEEAGDGITDKSRERLQRMLDKWCKDQDITSYEPDYSTVVVMPKRWWLEGLMCSQPGCRETPTRYNDDHQQCSLSCSEDSHMEIGLVYHEFPEIEK